MPSFQTHKRQAHTWDQRYLVLFVQQGVCFGHELPEPTTIRSQPRIQSQRVGVA